MDLTVDHHPAGPLPAGFFVSRKFQLSPSAGFVDWLAASGVSLAVSATDALVTIGHDGSGRLSSSELLCAGPRGFAVSGSETLWLLTGWQLVRFQNAVASGQSDERGYDAVYVEQEAHTIGAIGAFDAALDRDNRVLFTSARWSCVGTTSERASFTPVWQPPFVSALVDEGRCHLTGLELEDGELAYVTSASESDVAEGWRHNLLEGGLVIDARSGATIADGLSVPCSPRLHDGSLLVCSAGTGELLRIDPASGTVDTVTTMPALLRGLTVVGDRWAVVGCSWPAQHGPYEATSIAARVAAAERICGLVVVDLVTGEPEHTLWFEGDQGEILGVSALPGVHRPIASDPIGAVNEPLIIGTPDSGA